MGTCSSLLESRLSLRTLLEEKTEKSSEKLEKSSEKLEKSSEKLEKSNEKTEKSNEKTEKSGEKSEKKQELVDRTDRDWKCGSVAHYDLIDRSVEPLTL